MTLIESGADVVSCAIPNRCAGFSAPCRVAETQASPNR